MVTSKNGRAAYAQSNFVMKTPRATEYELLRQTTNRLSACMPNSRAEHAEVVLALHENRRMWSKLAASVADDENKLPQALRARLFYLFEFTLHHTRQVLSSESDVGVLVEINSAVMSGLSDYADAA